METTQIVWAALIIVFLIIEAVTAGLASIWFALGATAALILSFILPGALFWQIALFIVVSVITLVLTRPLARKYVNAKIKPTNADRVIGKTATVTKQIDNIQGMGEVSVDGRMWSARSDGDNIINVGELVVVKSISGVKLFVTPVNLEAKSTETVSA